MFEVFAADLMSRVMPAVTPTYHQGTISMVAIMFAIAGERWDTAASWRVEENDSLREIFRDSIDVIADRDLKERLTKLSETRDDDSSYCSADRKQQCDARGGDRTTSPRRIDPEP
jgi:hypothetical protein